MQVGTNKPIGGGINSSFKFIVHLSRFKYKCIHFNSLTGMGPGLPKISIRYICHFHTIVFGNNPPKYFIHVRSLEFIYVKSYGVVKHWISYLIQFFYTFYFQKLSDLLDVDAISSQTGEMYQLILSKPTYFCCFLRKIRQRGKLESSKNSIQRGEKVGNSPTYSWLP